MADPTIIWGPESGRPDAVPFGSPLLARRALGDDGPVIVWKTREALGGMTRADFEAALARLLVGRVESAWIFGSYWSPGFDRDSDIDLILVARTAKSFIDRPRDFDEIKDLVPDMDLLVYTPEEFARLTGDPSPGFWAGVVATMRRVL